MIEQIELMTAVAQDYTIQCGNIALFQALSDEGYTAYLQFPIVDWEGFTSVRDAGASDIYIDGPLGF